MSAQSCTSPSPAFGRRHAELPQAMPGIRGRAPDPVPAVVETTRAPLQGLFARLWRAYCMRRRDSRLRSMAADMDPHMLQDVGAPAWLVNETSVQRDLARLRNIDLIRW